MYDSGVGDLLRVLCQYWSVAFFSAAVIFPSANITSSTIDFIVSISA